MAGRKWRGRASGKQCQEYILQVSAWVPALTICSALGLATLPLAVTNPGWTVSPLALSTNAICDALCSTCWWPHSIRANSTSAGILLWLVPMAALALMLGWAHPRTQMSGFFTKAALMTFGGAYAVLPYVYQGR
ncbi:putative chromate transporter [Klebsiella pneumoniae subsp. rhinoscleromatis]|nr:putative chromate transporter [Klebsiella pneumoniae]STU49853.1 putative chromate transporter [Klebsiella pneumoniae]STV53747.1 putative chromate transporter [Klebsiella pneumoniae subsp. rhinoscleromatis]STW14022.1 putative chromate transporter [Klebsiella pneumoniae subsp. rhinoscleromatis]VTT31835.1 putative chromate transporter [Klebsiella pneumoniae]